MGNDLTIKWGGNRNDIHQLAEAGNINLSLPSTQFVSGGSDKSEGLFGLKTIHQFGHLKYNQSSLVNKSKNLLNHFRGTNLSGVL